MILQTAINDLEHLLHAAGLEVQKLKETPKDLKKPPPHKWEHGDIFRNNCGVIMIFVENPPEGYKHIFCISGFCHCDHSLREVENFLNRGEFLFNIKEKL